MDGRNPETIVPNTIIGGVMKCGTTTLHGFFMEHPDALASKPKEPHFFDREMNYRKGLDFYRPCFTGYTGQRAIVESTPFYIFFPEVCERIRRTLPEVRLIFIFRNPVDRAYSHFWQCYRNGWPWDDFIKAIEAPENRFLLSMGRYGALIERYLKVFPREQLLLLLTDELKNNKADVRRRCYEHAGIDPDFRPAQSSKKMRNVSTMPVSRSLQKLAYMCLLDGMKAEERYIYDADGLIVSERIPQKVDPLQKLKYRAYRFIRRNNVKQAPYPPLDRAARARVMELLRDDIERFAELTGLDVSAWLSN